MLLYKGMYINDGEADLILKLQDGDIYLPKVGKLKIKQLIALARVFRVHHNTLLCFRLSYDNWLSSYDNSVLQSRISGVLGASGSLTNCIPRVYNITRMESMILRDVWIIDIMSENDTTVDEMLLLSNSWKFKLFRWFL